MQRKRGFTLIELLVVIAIIAVLAAILFPVFARARRAAQTSSCQSNLKQIGSAVKMYLSDWQDTYPTNRPWTPPNSSNLGPVNAMVNITDPADVDNKFRYGITWVEGLYSYVEQSTKTGDPASVWKCPAAGNDTFPTNPTNQFPITTYAFNVCLVEQPEGIIKGAANLLMIREFGRQAVSCLRPSNSASMLPNGNYSYAPQYPFLNQADTLKNPLPATEYKLHANGSNVLLADGHVKYYELTYFPPQAQITAARCWDTNTQQWYNFYWANPSNQNDKVKNQSIAISP